MRDKSVELLLTKYSEEIFSPERVFTQIDLKNLINGVYPEVEPLSESESVKVESIHLMSFGQYIFEHLLIRKIKLSVISQELNVQREKVDSILEDEVTPWDLGADIIKKLETILGLDRFTTKRVIENHVIPKNVLEKRIPQGMNIAAGSAKELSDKERSAEIKESLRKIAISTEESRREELLSKLGRTISMYIACNLDCLWTLQKYNYKVVILDFDCFNRRKK